MQYKEKRGHFFYDIKVKDIPVVYQTENQIKQLYHECEEEDDMKRFEKTLAEQEVYKALDLLQDEVEANWEKLFTSNQLTLEFHQN